MDLHLETINPSQFSSTSSTCFNLNVYLIFQVSKENLWNRWKKKHYLYTVCWEPKSNVLFVHDTQCCYYLLSVQSVNRLLSLKKLKHHQECGMVDPTKLRQKEVFFYSLKMKIMFPKDWDSSDISSTIRCSCKSLRLADSRWTRLIWK